MKRKQLIYLLLSVLIALLLISVSYAQEESGLIRGWAFVDLDQDSVRDTGEPGLADTVICLVGYNWCDHTEWGEFMFDQLAPGKYKVRLDQFPGDYHLTTRRVYVIQLGPGEIRADVDFGLTEIPGFSHH